MCRFSLIALFCITWAIPSAGQAAEPQKPTLQPKIESKYLFALDHALLSQGTPQYFAQLIESQKDPETEANFVHILPLDSPGYFIHRGRDAYAIAIGMAAFTVQKPVAFYSPERLLSVDRMNRLTPELPARLDGDIPRHYISETRPGSRFTLETFSRDDLLALGDSRPELRYAEKAHPELGVPDRVAYQHTFDFGRLFGIKTAKGSLNLWAYYGVKPGQTLVQSYSLAYLENLPPRAWGGGKVLLDGGRDATMVLIERLRQE
jgi:hypothetical protein